MQLQLNEIRDQQHDTWNKFSGGWKKWNDFTMEFLKPMGNAIIAELDIAEKDIVLDIASGTGEPAITIAGIARKGKVVATDLSEQMLEAATENARSKGLQNFETVVTDVSELPFAENTFDKVSCRMGFMFFPDMQLAANEMHRVLKPGGRMATSIWYDPQKNGWITGIMGIINSNLQQPPPNPSTPSMFRCAQPGLIKSLLEKAGFKSIKEQEITGTVKYNDFEHFWTMTNDVAAPVVGALSKADNTMRTKIKNEMEAFAGKHTGPEGFAMEYCSLVISAEKK